MKIRILYAIESGGGSLKHLLYLINHLDRSKFEISLIYSKRDGANDFELKVPDGVNTFHIQMKKSINPFFDLISFVRFFIHLLKYKYDIIHLHSSKAGAIGRIVGFLFRIKKIIYTPHAFFFQSQKGYKYNFYFNLERFLAKITDYIILSDSEYEIALYSNLCQKNKLVNINNAIRFSEYQTSSSISELKIKFDLPTDSFVISSIGRLSKQKDLNTFIEICKRIIARNKNTYVLIVGEGELKNQVSDLIKNESNFRLLGHVKEISEIYLITNIIITTSLWEGLPYVILEAMYFNKFIVSNDINKSYINQHRNGFFFPNNKKELAVDYILKIIENPIGLNSISNEFLHYNSFDKFIRNHEKIYSVS